MPSQAALPNTTQFAYPAYWSAEFSTCVVAPFCFLVLATTVVVQRVLSARARRLARRLHDRCAWSEQPCIDPLVSAEQCLFFTVCVLPTPAHQQRRPASV
jgi:hypothetical protein